MTLWTVFSYSARLFRLIVTMLNLGGVLFMFSWWRLMVLIEMGGGATGLLRLG